jgi:hypothetical protein
VIFKIKYELGPTIAHLTSISTSLNFGLFYGAHQKDSDRGWVFRLIPIHFELSSAAKGSSFNLSFAW